MSTLPSAGALEARFGFFASADSAAHEVRPADVDGRCTCPCARCTAWSSFLRGTSGGGAPRGPDQRHARQYEVFTTDLVERLSFALISLRAHLRDPAPTPSTASRVLELGAGTGRLAHELRAALDRAGEAEVLLIASDLREPRRHSPDEEYHVKPYDAAAAAHADSSADCESGGGESSGGGEESVSSAEGAFPVLCADYRDALLCCTPDVAIVCWMPLGDDWTAALRACESVQAFLIIGDSTGMLCGQPHATWARARPALAGAPIPPRLHGWHARELPSVSRIQLCMVDEPWDNVRHSRTVIVARDERVAASVADAMARRWPPRQA
jgi:hypothetical protein